MKQWIYGIVAAVVASIVFSYAIAFLFWAGVAHFNAPSIQRLPFPASKSLTEEDAVALSRRALVLDGKESAGMSPVPYWHNDPRLFARNELNPESGYVLWQVDRPDLAWQYSVDITRDGDEVICEISRPL